MARGAGIILELQGGRPEDYAEVVKKCEENISLEELGIPPPGNKEDQGWGDATGNKRRR